MFFVGVLRVVSSAAQKSHQQEDDIIKVGRGGSKLFIKILENYRCSYKQPTYHCSLSEIFSYLLIYRRLLRIF